jgi:oxaloacetate decarboxylase alpha subunit
MTMTQIYFADTTIRDGPLSLWADNMRTGMMLSVAELLDNAGFQSIETIYVDPKKIVRELKEDPWERLRLLRQHITRTPLRLITGRYRPFGIAPLAMWELQMQCVARIGIRQLRISDEWNQPHMWAWKVRVARELGLDPVVNLIFSYSPKHTDDYYAERARAASSLDVFRLCLKDPGGLLTPERMQTLVPAVLNNAQGKYVELHSHCTTGLGPLNALEAVKLGIRTVNVGIPPLANGTALPSVYNVADNLRAMGYTPVFDEPLCRQVEQRLTYIAKREGMRIGQPVEPDVSQYHHQVPGGMLTNLRHQLKLIGLEHRYDEALEECARVREEWGWPVMVTPLSQFVGSQAAVNVIAGGRYDVVTDQTIHYALGRWGGQECIDAMDPNVRDKILDRPRGRELAAWEPPQPTVEEVRQQYGAPGLSDEELLLRYEIAESEIESARAAGSPHPYPVEDQPLLQLLQELAARTDRAFITVQKGELTFSLQKAEAARPGPASSPAGA